MSTALWRNEQVRRRWLPRLGPVATSCCAVLLYARGLTTGPVFALFELSGPGFCQAVHQQWWPGEAQVRVPPWQDTTGALVFRCCLHITTDEQRTASCHLHVYLVVCRWQEQGVFTFIWLLFTEPDELLHLERPDLSWLHTKNINKLKPM